MNGGEDDLFLPWLAASCEEAAKRGVVSGEAMIHGLYFRYSCFPLAVMSRAVEIQGRQSGTLREVVCLSLTTVFA